MSSTFLSLSYHIVFATKGRLPLIQSEWRDRLHRYLGGAVNGLGGVPLAIGGVADHVHLLVGLRATHCLADFMREVKRQSSVWVRDELRITGFAWQEGYSAFTVSPTALGGVRSYIETQDEHHRQRTFRDELIELLTKAEIMFDPKYLD